MLLSFPGNFQRGPRRGRRPAAGRLTFSLSLSTLFSPPFIHFTLSSLFSPSVCTNNSRRGRTMMVDDALCTLQPCGSREWLLTTHTLLPPSQPLVKLLHTTTKQQQQYEVSPRSSICRPIFRCSVNSCFQQQQQNNFLPLGFFFQNTRRQS